MDEMVKLLAVAGHPIAHSLSPRIHNHFATEARLPYVYAAFDVPADCAETLIETARFLCIKGLNLTMPLKERVLPFLDALDDGARRQGTVNTVVERDGVLKGYNTDGDGFWLSLERMGFVPARDGALILGAGGAAKAVAATLAQKGLRVRLASRRPDDLPPPGPGVTYCHWNERKTAAVGCALLINATPLGMVGTDTDFSDLSFLDELDPDAVVYDLIYAPRETTLMKAARAKGLRVSGGLSHLLFQAALSFRLFTGVMPSQACIEDLLRRLV